MNYSETPKASKIYAARSKIKSETDLNSLLAHLYRRSKSNAKTVRNIHFSLTPIEMGILFEFQDWKCAFSDRKLSMKTNDPDRASMDRIDSDLGYTMKNVHFVTARINRMKGDMTWDEFVSTCKQVAKHCK